MSTKREDYISWDEYFMGVAKLSASRSKDPNTQVGCCIVSQDNKILSMGYNGFPIGCSDDMFPWVREGEDDLFPCNECAKAIIQSGIKEVIYDCNKYDGSSRVQASMMMFDAAGVKYHQYQRSGRKIEIEL